MLDKGWREWAQIMAEVKPSLYEASWKKEIGIIYQEECYKADRAVSFNTFMKEIHKQLNKEDKKNARCN
mgnify:CR=1 FL=1